MRDFREPASRPCAYMRGPDREMRPCAIHLRRREVPFAWPLQGRLHGRSYRLAASTLLLLRRAVMALAVGGAVTPDLANFTTRFSAGRSGLPQQRCAATCAMRPPSCTGCGCRCLGRECAHVRACFSGRSQQQRSSHPSAVAGSLATTTRSLLVRMASRMRSLPALRPAL